MTQTAIISQPRASRAHDVWRGRGNPLQTMFAPRSVAVIGATEAEGSVGRTIVENIKSGGFAGPLYPVNPKRDSVLGLKAYPSIGDVSESVDLAVIVTAARTVPGIVTECAQAGVPGAVIISAGCKDTGLPR